MDPFRFTRSLQTESASQKQDYVRLTKNSAENLSTQSLALGSFLAGATDDGNLPGLASGALAPSSFKPFTPGLKYQVSEFDNPYKRRRLGLPDPTCIPWRAAASPCFNFLSEIARARESRTVFSENDKKIAPRALEQFNKLVSLPCGRVSHKEVAITGSLQEQDEKQLHFWVSEAVSVSKTLAHRSSVWKEFREAAKSSDNTWNEGLFQQLVFNYLKKGRWRTLRGHVLIAKRLCAELQSLKLDPADWAFGPVYQVMYKRQKLMLLEETASGKLPPAATFSSLCRTIKFLKKIWGLDVPSDNHLAMLGRLASIWASDHLGETRQAA